MTKTQLKKTYEKEIKRIVDALRAYNPERIILFGSAARGEFRPGSDLDLLIVKKTKKPFLERNIEARGFINTTVPVDIFVLTPKEFEKGKKDWQPFVIDVLEEGKVIYG